ncbi:MAG: YdcF family protein [Candidatus Margulisbacteria bacterium]|jgi:uncharacterized SAM-binding protein YcdF (DUF218 family)|nr:YdcF family protein [Candidatus Margulisiibacteriota bacterium]
MFILGKIFTWSLLSPGLFLLLLLLGLAAALSNKRRACVFLLILSCAAIYFLSVKPGRDRIIVPLETKYPRAPEPQIDALIVLGGGVSPRGELSDASLQRLHAAYRIYRQKPVPLIVCGGDPLGDGVKESAVLAAALADWQVPPAKIIQEDQSRNTQENLENAKKYLQKYKLQKPGLLTSAAHLPRAMLIAESLGLQPRPLPCDFSYDGEPYRWYDIFPNADCLKDSFAGLKEYAGIFYYRVLQKMRLIIES